MKKDDLSILQEYAKREKDSTKLVDSYKHKGVV